MPRKRQIDPDIWTSEQFVNLSIEARLLFIGTITLADDEGRLKGSSLYLKAALFSCDTYTREKVNKWRDELLAQGLAQLYHLNGQEYINLPNFKKYQYMTRRFASKLPDPAECDVEVPSDKRKKEPKKEKEEDNGNWELEIGNGEMFNPSLTNHQPVNDKLLTNDSGTLTLGEFENVYISAKEHERLTERFGEQDATERIEELSSAIKSKGLEKKYTSHYATILTWDRLEQKRNKEVPHDKPVSRNQGTSPIRVRPGHPDYGKRS